MPDCEFIEACPFFNDKMNEKPTTAEMMKKNYCRNKFKHCARYLVRQAQGKEKVPADLYPGDIVRGLKLAAEEK